METPGCLRSCNHKLHQLVPMTPRELVVKTLNHDPIPRVPRDLWIDPEVESASADEVAEISLRFPSDILPLPPSPAFAVKCSSKSASQKEWTDVWGCGWRNSEDGAPPELQNSPLSDSARIAAFQPPPELVDRKRFNRANDLCSQTPRFVLARAEVRPFDRFRFLRGSKAALMDISRGTKRGRSLLNMLHEAACEELRCWAATEVDGVVIGDDWGAPEGMLIELDAWRDIFRPFYDDYCKILHDGDKFVFFRSQGNIREIFADLVKLEVDAVHAQLHLMNFERLAKRFRGQITFWGECPDNRLLHEPGSVEEFRQTVLAARRELDYGAGGVIAQCRWEPGVRLQTIAAFFEQWLVSMPMYA